MEKVAPKQEKILHIYAQGVLQVRDVSNDELSEMTDLGLSQLRVVRRELRRKGYLPAYDPASAHNPKSEKQRAKTAESLRWVWDKIGPLLLRDGMPFEVEEITGVPSERVTGFTVDNRNLLAPYGYYSPEKLAERRRKASVRASRKRKGINPSESELKAIGFAKVLYEKGFFGEDLTYREITKVINGQAKRRWFESFPMSLIMEFYVASRVEEISGNSTKMDLFNELGTQFDSKWFNSVPMNIEKFAARDVIETVSRRLSK